MTTHEQFTGMQYNTQRDKLIIPEYGRHVQKMIDIACAETDKTVRNQMANGIIAVMGQLNPQGKDNPDFSQKLWDHLIIISNFRLDVDSPYPKPTHETVSAKPERIKYPDNRIAYKHYGKSLEQLINKVIEMEENEEKNQSLKALANLMKRFYLTWNRDTVSDDVIFDQIDKLSKGKLNTQNLELTNTSEILYKNKINVNRPNNNQNNRKNLNKKKQNNNRKKF